MAQFFLVCPSPGFHAAPTLGIVRQRLVGDVWMEDTVVVNHRDEHAMVALDLEAGSDFADRFEVKDNTIRERRIDTECRDQELVLRYHNGQFVRETRITVSETATIEPDAVQLNLQLARGRSGVSRLSSPRTPTTTTAATARGAPAARVTSCAGNGR